MLPLGIALGVGGYTLIYYGAKLWAGTPVTLAEAVGLSSSAPEGGTTTVDPAGSFWGSIKHVIPFAPSFVG